MPKVQNAASGYIAFFFYTHRRSSNPINVIVRPEMAALNKNGGMYRTRATSDDFS